MTSSTLLLRQVHPSFAPGGVLTSQAFFPFPKDEGKLSAYDGDQVRPAESYEHYTAILHNASVGVWGVTCEEVSTVGLTSKSDPLDNFPAHALIDFGNQDEKACRRLAKKLKAAALAHGCLFAP